MFLLAIVCILAGLVIGLILHCVCSSGEQHRRMHEPYIPSNREQRIVRTTNPLMLNEVNFHQWLRTLKVEMRKCGLIDAIERKLAVTDPRNEEAYNEIVNRLPSHMHGVITSTESAFEAINLLWAEYGAASDQTREAIRNRIKATKLDSFSEEAIDKHLVFFEEQCTRIIEAGGELSLYDKLGLLADTLPTTRTEYSAFETVFRNATVTRWMDAKTQLRNQFRVWRNKGWTAMDPAEKAYYAGNRRSNRGSGSNQNEDTDQLMLCYNCWQWSDHISNTCPNPKVPKPASRIPYPRNVNKVVSSRYPRISVLDSGSMSHHSNSSANFVSLRPLQSSVTMADGSTCTSRGIGTVMIQTGKGSLELDDVKLT